MNEDETKEFNKAAQAYIAMFGGSLPLGIGYPALTTKILEKAVVNKQPIDSITPKNQLS